MANSKLMKTLFGTDKPLTVIPGALLALAVMLVSVWLADALGGFFKAQFNLDKSPVSTFLLAIIVGMVVRNVIPLPKQVDAGIKFCVAKLLRLGIMFLGIRLSVLAAAKIGIVAVVVVVLCISAGIAVSLLLARLFGVSDRLGTLIAAGTGICGVSAIVATAPTIDAKEEETTYAISTITIFGLLATIVYPYLAELVLHLNPAQAGIFLGTAVHDTSQVTGAAYIYDQLWNQSASKIAITTKLVRNTFLMAVVPLCAIMYARRQAKAASEVVEKINVWKYFPMFVLGFLGFALFRSIGDIFAEGESGRFLFWNSEAWSSLCGMIKTWAKNILAVAIAAAGLSTQFKKLKQLSLKPFMIGMAAALTVGALSYILVTVLQGPIAKMIGG
ncbi:MAG: putative sulfate exporter family transporter [Lentisphaerae bacterium]|nr:putative sulfate exporter family transporter [Lentisphaerota bacterium]